MLRALKRTVETIVADLMGLGELPIHLECRPDVLVWAIRDVVKVGALWDCVLELDSLAKVADTQGYAGVAERYRRASRNLKPAIVNYEGSR